MYETFEEAHTGQEAADAPRCPELLEGGLIVFSRLDLDGPDILDQFACLELDRQSLQKLLYPVLVEPLLCFFVLKAVTEGLGHGAKYQLLILGEDRWQVGEGWTRQEMETQDGGRIYLWGHHHSFLEGVNGRAVPHEWVQASIPRPLCYPLQARKEYVYLETVDYRREGMILLTRFKRLGGEDREEGER